MDEHTDIDTDELAPLLLPTARRFIGLFSSLTSRAAHIVKISSVSSRPIHAPTSPNLSYEIKTIQCGLAN